MFIDPQISVCQCLPHKCLGMQLCTAACIRACVRANSLWLCPTLCNPMDCSLPGFSVHRILQARILEWVAMPPSRDQTVIFYVSCICWHVLYNQVLPGKPIQLLPSINLILYLISVFYIDRTVLEGRDYGCVDTSTYQSQGHSRSSTDSYSINECYLCLKFIKRKWQPTPLFLPGECHGQRSLASYSPWGHKSQT